MPDSLAIVEYSKFFDLSLYLNTNPSLKKSTTIYIISSFSNLTLSPMLNTGF